MGLVVAVCVMVTRYSDTVLFSAARFNLILFTVICNRVTSYPQTFLDWTRRIVHWQITIYRRTVLTCKVRINPYPTAFPYGNGMVLHFYQQQESSTTKTVHKVINKGLKTYV